MATVFKLRWNTTDCLLNSTAATGIKAVKWYPAAGSMDGGPVTESMDIQVHGSSDDNLATHIQALDGMRKRAYDYMHDTTVQYPVWLHVKMDGETGERRSLVRLIDMSWQSDPVDNVGFAATNKAKFRLTIEREPWWERTTSQSLINNDVGEQTGAALYFDHTVDGSDPVGDVPARIEGLTLVASSGTTFNRTWLAFRSADKHASIGNFESIWECEDGTLNAAESGISVDSSSDVNDSSPGGGSGAYVELVETDLEWDDTWHEILQLELQDITAAEESQFGSFQWLFRAQNSGASTIWQIQFRWGYAATTDDYFVRSEINEVTSTSWDILTMGRQEIPLRNLHALPLASISGSFEQTYAVQIWAKRTAGSANLHLDCVLPLPVDEGWLYSEQFECDESDAARWLYSESPEGQDQAITYKIIAPLITTTFGELAVFYADSFRVPVGDARIMMVYAGESSQDITTGIAGPNIVFYPRWANLRGGE